VNRHIQRLCSRSRSVTWGLLLSVVCVGSAVSGLRAQEKPSGFAAGDHPYFKTIPLHGFATEEETIGALINALTVPMWTYQVTAQQDGGTYTGTMIGSSAPWLGSTNVSTKIIPLIIHTPDGFTFDPTAPDPCAAAPLTNTSDLTLFQQSPIFVNHAYTMNGVNVGTTQYIDAFQRASFWNIGASGFNTLLSPVATLSAVTITVPSGSGTSQAATCGRLGKVDIGFLGNYLEGTLIPALAGSGVTSTTLPIFLLGNVVMTDGNSCCILGYHSAFNSGGNVQTYSVMDFDVSRSFTAQDAAVAAHEIGEWLDDPLGTNPTPPWGHTGQVPGCQDNLEVGDPLSGTAISVAMPNGYTYHLQELAFFSWFFGGPSLGAGSRYSSNGTFAAPAVLCSAGFTVGLSASNTTPAVGASVTLIATANQDVGPTPYYILIFDGAAIIRTCASGTICSVGVSSSTATTKTYVAKIALSDGSSVQATSSSVTVTWSSHVGATPLYRFFNVVTSTHFYTISEAEKNNVMATLPQYHFEGIAYYVLGSPAPQASPVYRFFNVVTSTHFYTINEAEKNNVMATLPQYHFEGVAFYAYPGLVSGTSPVYRFFNVVTSTHFYTISEAEKNTVMATLPQYHFEGAAYLAYPTP
jgi:hypothetical protein